MLSFKREKIRKAISRIILYVQHMLVSNTRDHEYPDSLIFMLVRATYLHLTWFLQLLSVVMPLSTDLVNCAVFAGLLLRI